MKIINPTARPLNAHLRMKNLFVIIFILFLTSGCAHIISLETLKKTDARIAFKMLLSEPDAYKGKVVLVGGEIIETINTQEGSFITVMQKPLDKFGAPVEKDISEGRFLISYPGFLEPKIYAPGKKITVAGEVIGSKKMALGKMEYLYPLLLPIEMKLPEEPVPPGRVYTPDYLRTYPPQILYGPDWCKRYPFSEIYRQDKLCPVYPYPYPYSYPYIYP